MKGQARDWRARWRRWEARWGWLGAGLGTALFALRVGLEGGPRYGWWGAVAGLAGLGIAYLLARLRTQARLYAPLALLWAYLLWPAAAPALAFGLGFVALAAVSILALEATLGAGFRPDRLPLDRPGLADVAVGLGFFALYLSTLAPTILPADSGEFQIVGPLLGVAHPPGYALFTMLAKLFSLIPLGEVAWRLNLMGAVTGAATLVVVARTARRVTGGSVWAGLAAAGALGVSTTFWAQSTTINIRMQSILFVALCLSFLVRFLDVPAASRRGARALTGLAVSWGLAVAHTAWPAFFAPLFAAVILWHDPGLLRRARQWPRLLLAFALPFLSDLYIFVRAATGAPFGTEELVDAGRVVDHLLGRGFGGDMFAYLSLNRFLGERFLVMGNIFGFQFHLPLLIVAGLGFIVLARRRTKVALLLGGLWATMTLIVATYRAPQSVEYLMPAYLPIALSIGYALSLVDPTLPRIGCPYPGSPTPQSPIPKALLLAALLLPILLLAQANLPSYRLLHHDRSARAYAEGVLLDAPPNAHILSNWHWYTPLRYLQLVEGRRPDVEISYLYPQGAAAMPQAWPQRILAELERSARPLIVTNRYPTYADLPLRLEPLGEAFLVRAEPAFQAPANLMPLGPDGAGIELYLEGASAARGSRAGGPAIRVLGYHVQTSPDAPSVATPGGEVSVDLIWQPVARLEQDYAIFVHLVGESGVPMGQQDRRQAGARVEPGEVRVDRYRFPVHLSAAPGAYRLIAGAYVTDADGSWQRMVTARSEDVLPLSDLSVEAAPLPPVTLHPAQVRFVGADSALLGVDYDDTLPEQRRVYLHWRAGREPVLARLWSGGQVVAQGIVPAGEGGYVSTALDVPPGAQDLRLELQSAGETSTGGMRTLPYRGAWGLARSSPLALPAPDADQRYVPFGSKMLLVDAQVQPEWPVGQDARVALRFVAQRPIVLDYVVSVGVSGQALTDAPSDWVPALGAIPTFKWVRGSWVNDVHLIRAIEGQGSEIEVSVGVYDAFTTAALPPLDERIARQGRAGVALGRAAVVSQ